jgi:hypothetical protein
MFGMIATWNGWRRRRTKWQLKSDIAEYARMKFLERDLRLFPTPAFVSSVARKLAGSLN